MDISQYRLWPGVVYPVFIVVATLAVYYQVHSHYFVWDTIPFVIENPWIHDPGLADFVAMFTDAHRANWHPMVLLSHALDFQLFGMAPAGHHLVNVVFHGINSCLVYVLVSMILAGNGEVRYRHWIAFLTGIMFAIHPQHVESVAWLVERKDVLYGIFALLALVFYLRRYRLERVSWWGRMAPVVFFILSLMSKPMAVTLPVVMVLLDIYPLKRWPDLPGGLVRSVAEKWLYWLLALAVGLITLNTQSSAMVTIDDLPLWARTLTTINNLLFYATGYLMPVGLSPLYPYPAFAGMLLAPSYWLPGTIFLLVTTAAVVWLWRQSVRWPALLWAFYVVTLLPVAGLIHVGPARATDHYTYFATTAIGLLIALAIGRGLEIPRARALVLALGIAWIGTLGALAHVQVKVWHDPVSLWTYTLRLYPESALAHRNMASALYSLGEYERALEHASLSVKYGGPAEDFVRKVRERLKQEQVSP